MTPVARIIAAVLVCCAAACGSRPAPPAPDPNGCTGAVLKLGSTCTAR